MKTLKEINPKKKLKSEISWDKDEDRLTVCGVCIYEENIDELIDNLVFVVDKFYRQSITELLEEIVGDNKNSDDFMEFWHKWEKTTPAALTNVYNQAKVEIRERIKLITE